MAIGPERLTSRQQARLSAVLRERAELVERRKKRRTMRKRKKRSKRSSPSPLLVYGYGAVGKGPALARRRLVVVDVSVNMYDMFQQLPIYSGRCLLPFLRQSGGHSSYATETSTVVYRCSSWTMLFSCLVLCNDRPSWSSQCRFLRWFRSCSSSMVVDIPVFAQLLLPMVLPVQKTIETPQLQSVRWSMPLLCRSCHARCRADRCLWFRHCRKLLRCRSCSSLIRHLCRGAETDSHGPVQDHRTSPVAVH